MLTHGALLQNRYRVIRQLGGGGQAVVYLAEDLNLGVQRAVKELLPGLAATPQERQVAYDQFRVEARMLASLNHPNLARVWDYFQVGDNAYLVIDYVDGRTLQEVLDQTSGLLPEAAVLRWAGQLCDVLDYLHTRQPPIVFRDMKPSNIMLDSNDTIRLIDFGIARLFRAGKTADTVKMGTPGYAPPEQHGGGQTDARSDIYGLGATLYHLLTGHEPEQAPARAISRQADPLRPARVYNPTISQDAEAVLTRALAVDPSQRFQSALEMKQALPRRPTVRGRSKRRWMLAALAMLFVVGLIFLLTKPGVPDFALRVIRVSHPSPAMVVMVPDTPTLASPLPVATHTPTPSAQPAVTPTPRIVTTRAPELIEFRIAIAEYRLAEKAALRRLDPAASEQLPTFAHGEALAAVRERVEQLKADGLYQELGIQRLEVQQVVLRDPQIAGAMVQERYILRTYRAAVEGDRLIDEEVFDGIVVYGLIYADRRWKVERIRLL